MKEDEGNDDGWQVVLSMIVHFSNKKHFDGMVVPDLQWNEQILRTILGNLRMYPNQHDDSSHFGSFRTKSTEMSHILDVCFYQTGDGKIDMEDVKIWWKKFKTMMTYQLPDATGFSMGFLAGVKYG
jgi:hypothetical protein